MFGLHTASEVLLLFPAVGAQRIQKRPLTRVGQDRFSRLWQSVVLFRVPGRHRREVVLDTERRRLWAVDKDLALALYENRRVRVDVGIMAFTVNHRRLLMMHQSEVSLKVCLLTEPPVGAETAIVAAHPGVNELVTSQITGACRDVTTLVTGERPTTGVCKYSLAGTHTSACWGHQTRTAARRLLHTSRVVMKSHDSSRYVLLRPTSPLQCVCQWLMRGDIALQKDKLNQLRHSAR